MAQELAMQRSTGVMLVVVSAVVFSAAGIFTKGVSAGAWEIVFWRGLAAAGFTLTYLAMRGSLAAEARVFRGPSVAVAVLGAAGTAAFIPAFKLSSVANVSMIYAASPFLAAALAWVFIRERPGLRTLMASAMACGGVAVIFWGSGVSGYLTGDLLALWMTLMMAGMMVIYRIWPETPAGFPAAMSSLFLVPLGATFGNPLSVSMHEIAVILLFGLFFAVASVTLAEGARRLPPAQTALLSTLEMPLAPLLAWVILAEVPAGQTAIGGVVVCLAVLWSQRES
ncbi:EamA-like transporter family protein [Falsiruegeria litorea R37]|uniref:EamA-like transporter family protein n=1 Tax=Falsiruegeria litorea R37 TaxID=1200284 RepID=A0A1Y5RES0_9RHOB|nr:DMT family transporter [Falsiruegeria litorea]SLN15542.1 EamA-like transporter family protein [Falsiruegeria litorea R37]